MAIEFSCPSCQRPYRVKDELGGKTANCGKCGNRMQVPKQVALEPAPTTVEPELESWMAEELTAKPAVRPKPKPTRVECPKCGATQEPGASICAECFTSLAPPAKPVKSAPVKPVLVKSVPAKAGPPKRKITWKPNFQLGFTGSLMRGTLLSVVFALVGALLWAVVAYLTMREIGLIAIALGGLSGFGMALGHEDDDGTTAGIIAAFVSLFGIVAAKVLIIVIFVAAAVANVVGNIEMPEGDADPNALARTFLATAVAEDAMRGQGINPEDATDEQREAAMATARAEVADLDEAGIDKRFSELNAKRAKEVPVQNLAGAQNLAGDQNAAVAAEADADVGAEAAELAESDEEADQPGFVGLFFREMFNPIDGLFMLLAFATAYKVGSGKQTD